MCAATLLGCSLGAQAQVHLRVDGTVINERLGWYGIVPLGDVNFDGTPDFASASGGVSPRYVRAYSGATGSPLWTITEYPTLLSGGGDVDGDGVRDILLWLGGAPTQYGSAGAISVLSGSTGSLIRTHYGSGIGVGMGAGSTILGDVDADGFDDYALCDNTNANAPDSALAWVVSGKTGAQIYSIGYVWRVTNWLTRLGDVDGDERADFAVTSTACGTTIASSCIAVFSGASGQFLYRINHPAYNLYFQGPDCGGRDIDGDGIGDFVYAGGVYANGLVEARSGATGALIWSRVGGASSNSRLGEWLALGDDWNGDGRCEVLASQSNPAQLLVLSGLDGSTLSATPTIANNLGRFPFLSDDFDGDGGRELLSCGGSYAFWIPYDNGSLFVTKHANASLSSTVDVGVGCLTATGRLPRAFLRGDPTLGSTAALRLRATDPGSQPVLVIGLPFPPGISGEWTQGCRIYVDPLLLHIPLPSDANGVAAADFPVPAAPSLAGLRLGVQWFVFDPLANPSGAVGSNALTLRLGN